MALATMIAIALVILIKGAGALSLDRAFSASELRNN